MLLDNGLIVRTVDRIGKNDRIAADSTSITQLPLAVLVDGNSASCSEILTGALKDNQRAVVVGTKTYGKALVQAVHKLSDGSGMAVTIAHYYTPNGTDINHKGILPDIQIELNKAQRQKLVDSPDLIGTGADPQYAKAVASLKGKMVAGKSTASSPTPQEAVVPVK
jgi:carboxyl-terminal processing protease